MLQRLGLALASQTEARSCMLSAAKTSRGLCEHGVFRRKRIHPIADPVMSGKIFEEIDLGTQNLRRVQGRYGCGPGLADYLHKIDSSSRRPCA